MPGVNRFDQPAQSQFINTYVPIPFDQMMQAGAMKQQRYDQTAAATDQALAQAEQLTAIPNSIDEQYMATVRDTMRDIRDKYATMDLSDSMVVREMNNEMNQRINKELVRKAQESRAAWDVAQKTKQQLIAQGKYNPLLDKDPGEGYDSSTGTYAYTPQGEIDRYDTAKSIFGDLTPRSMEAKADGMYKIYDIIDDTDIQGVANTRWSSFADTTVGQQLMELYAVRNDLDYDAMVNDPESARALAVGTLMDLGQEFKVNRLRSATQLREEKSSPTIPPFNPWNLYNTQNAASDEIGDKSFNKLSKETKTLLESADPVARAEGERRTAIAEQISRDVRETYEPKVDDIIYNTVDKMVSDGTAGSREEAIQMINHFMSNPNELRSAMIAKGTQNIGADIGNSALFLIRGLAKVIKAPVVGAASILDDEAVTDILTKGDFTKFSENYKKWSDQIMPTETGTFSKNSLKGAKQEFLRMNKELTEVNKDMTGEIQNSTLDAINKTPVTDYALDVPLKYSNDFNQVIGPNGEPMGSAALPKITQDVLWAPKNYGILESDITNTKGKTGKIDLNNLKEYQVNGVTVNTSLKAKDDYLPTITLRLEKDGKFATIDMKVRHPSQIEALISDMDKAGNTKLVSKLIYGNIDKKLDLVTPSSGIEEIDLGGGETMSISPGIRGGTYNVTYGGRTFEVSSIAEAKEKMHKYAHQYYLYMKQRAASGR